MMIFMQVPWNVNIHLKIGVAGDYWGGPEVNV
jgi:hypothetical protein